MPSPADELRAAAAHVRERAGKAAEWFAAKDFEDDYPAMVENWLGGPVGEHAAGWSPPPALAVAAWLDLSAAQYEEADAALWQVEYHLTQQAVDAALAVARTIPGGET
jgi:hypothetical protein